MNGIEIILPLSIIPKYANTENNFIKLYVFINAGLKIAANVPRLATVAKIYY